MNWLKTIWAKGMALTPAVMAAIKAPGKIAGKLITEHKAIRRGVLVWVAYLVTYATHRVFENSHMITTPEAAAYATVTALLAVAIGFYKPDPKPPEPPK